MHAVGLYLEELRRAEGLTQKAAASRVGRHSKTIERWEAGTHEPALTDLKDYVKALKGSIDRAISLLLERDAPIELSEEDKARFLALNPDERRIVLDLIALLRKEIQERPE